MTCRMILLTVLWGTAEAQAIVGKVLEKIKAYPADRIYATRDTHGENYVWKRRKERAFRWFIVCAAPTAGRSAPEIARAMPDAVIVDKPTFGSTALAELLFEENKKETLEIELVGLCTDICVVSNALLLKSFMPDNRIAVDPACCAGVTPKSHEAALLTMKMCQIAMEGQEQA